MEKQKIAVLFVCLGNICRSPTAEGIFRRKVKEAGLDAEVLIDSCGTGSWHIGNPPDERALAYAATQGIDLSGLRARKLSAADYSRFDYVIAMDMRNLKTIKARAPKSATARISLLLDFDPHSPTREVPDPYYGGEDGFRRVYTLVNNACDRLLDDIRKRLERGA